MGRLWFLLVFILILNIVCAQECYEKESYIIEEKIVKSGTEEIVGDSLIIEPAGKDNQQKPRIKVINTLNQDIVIDIKYNQIVSSGLTGTSTYSSDKTNISIKQNDEVILSGRMGFDAQYKSYVDLNSIEYVFVEPKLERKKLRVMKTEVVCPPIIQVEKNTPYWWVGVILLIIICVLIYFIFKNRNLIKKIEQKDEKIGEIASKSHKTKEEIKKLKILSKEKEKYLKDVLDQYKKEHGHDFIIDKRGYIRFAKDYKDPSKVGQYFHIWWYKKHKGPIPHGYEVHHKNGIKLDNKISNLEAISKEEHDSLHSRKQ